MTRCVLAFIDRCQELVGSDMTLSESEFHSALRSTVESIPDTSDRLEELLMKAVLAEIIVRRGTGIDRSALETLFLRRSRDELLDGGGLARVSGHGTETTQKRLSPQVRAALDFVHHRYADRALSLAAAAVAVRVSRCHLSHLIRQETGLTFSEHVMRYRTLKAELLLRSTDLPVKEIAIDVGYLYTNELDRNFKRHYGCSPTRYRQSLRTSKLA
jgi:AraC-like DNA-binding protein